MNIKKLSASLISLAVLFSSLGNSAELLAGNFAENTGASFSATPSVIAIDGSLNNPVNPETASGLGAEAISETLEQVQQVQGNEDLRGIASASAYKEAPVAAEASAAAIRVAGQPEQASASFAQANAPTAAGVSAAATKNPGQARQTLFARIKNALSRPSQIFDGAGSYGELARSPARGFAFAPGPRRGLKRLEGVTLNKRPILPDSRHIPVEHLNSFNHLALPGAQNLAGLLNQELPVQDATNLGQIHQALLQLIDQNPQYGLSTQELKLENMKFVEGGKFQNQAPTIYAVFHQKKRIQDINGSPRDVEIYGAYPEFIIKIENGRPIVKGLVGQAYRDISFNTTQKLSSLQMQLVLRKQLGSKLAVNHNIVDRGLQIVYLENLREPTGRWNTTINYGLRFWQRLLKLPQGAWHTVNVYTVPGMDTASAVDITTGEVFFWDPQQFTAAAQANLKGWAFLTDHDAPTKLSQVAIPYVAVPLPDGRTVYSDKDGHVAVDLPDGQEIQATVKLDGQFAVINNKAGDPIEVQVTLKADGTGGATVFFNVPPALQAKAAKAFAARQALASASSARRIFGAVFSTIKKWILRFGRWVGLVSRYAPTADEMILAQVTTYVAHQSLVQFGKAHGIGVNDGILDKKFVINVNMNDMGCNAYYDEESNTLNLELSTEDCNNTGESVGVGFHESGHWIHFNVAAIGQLMANAIAPHVDGGLSEGIGDTFSIFILRSKLIGENFFKDPTKPFLRTADNTYQFSNTDEVHDQGLAWMGAAGKLPGTLADVLKISLDDAWELAAQLIFPNIYGYATAQDIPAAMRVIMLAATKTDGSMHDGIVSAWKTVCAAHGIDLSGAVVKLAKSSFSARLSRQVRDALGWK